MFKKNLYHRRHFFLLIKMMIAPFMGFTQLGIVEDVNGAGAGEGTSKGEDILLLEKIEKQTKDKLNEAETDFS